MGKNNKKYCNSQRFSRYIYLILRQKESNMTEEFQIRVLPQVAYNEANLKAYLAQEKGFDPETIYRVRVLKRSIDARHRDIYVNLKVRVYVNEFPQDDAYVKTEYQDVSNKPSVIVVGEGPGGLFAALKLI